VGPHAGILFQTHKTATKIIYRLGGSPWSGMVGPHAQEWWVHMLRNIQINKLFPDIFLLDKLFF